MRLWEMIAQRFRAPSLMERMFARFGLNTRFDDPHLAGEALRAAVVRCMSCGRAKECAAWLEEARGTEATDPPAWCRNLQLIQRLRRDAEALH